MRHASSRYRSPRYRNHTPNCDPQYSAGPYTVEVRHGDRIVCYTTSEPPAQLTTEARFDDQEPLDGRMEAGHARLQRPGPGGAGADQVPSQGSEGGEAEGAGAGIRLGAPDDDRCGVSRSLPRDDGARTVST